MGIGFFIESYEDNIEVKDSYNDDYVYMKIMKKFQVLKNFT